MNIDKEFGLYINNFINDMNETDSFVKLTKYIDNKKMMETRENILYFFNLILSIAENNNNSSNFDNKIAKVISFYINDIKLFFTDYDIFTVFKSNKSIILYLIFNGSILLKKIVMTPTITIIEYKFFEGLTSLEEITLTSTLNIIDDYAFNGCTSLKKY